MGKRRRIGSDDTGDVYEQQLRISDDPEMPPVRRITVVLNEPTRDGETELHILSNVPVKDASARTLAALYRKRWTIETVFADIARTLTGEIPSLGYPPAALLALCLSFVIYNAVSMVESAMGREHGRATIFGKVSPYYLCLEIEQATDGMLIAIPPEHWRVFATMPISDFAATLREIASHMRLERYRKHTRGPKKPKPPRGKYTNGAHASTARLIANQAPPPEGVVSGRPLRRGRGGYSIFRGDKPFHRTLSVTSESNSHSGQQYSLTQQPEEQT